MTGSALGSRQRRNTSSCPGIAADVCLRPQPITSEAVAEFAARSRAPSTCVISDRLWCFGAVQMIGADHQRVVTSGREASTALPHFRAIYSFLGILERYLGGTC